MKQVGVVGSLWRFPVKSMRGEELDQAFASFGGIYGDRWYAIHSSGSIPGFPYLTPRDLPPMLLYSATYRNAQAMSLPPNLSEAQDLGPGVTPIFPDASDCLVDVQTPDGRRFAIDDPALLDLLRENLPEKHHRLAVLRSQRPMTDCRPLGLISEQTVQQLSREVGEELGVRQFRANINLDLAGAPGYAEDEFIGRNLRIGGRAVITVLERDPRCKMITLDPDTAAANPEVIKVVARQHNSKAGIYAAVLVEGVIRRGDPVTLLD